MCEENPFVEMDSLKLCEVEFFWEVCFKGRYVGFINVARNPRLTTR